MLGVMANGNTVVPLDIQLDVEGLADCLNRSDVDILFYDWEHHPLVEGVKALCPESGLLYHYSTENMFHALTIF